MISEFENLSLGGNNAASNHGDPFTHTGIVLLYLYVSCILTSNECYSILYWAVHNY